MNPKISVVIHTASRDDFLAHHGIPSAAAMVAAELERQPFRAFELVYVDRWRDGQPFLFDRIPHSFQVKHVSVHPGHRYWYNRGLCHIAAAKNTGILYADGELIVSVDDAAVFNTNDFLELYWDAFQRNLLLHAGYCRWSEIEVRDGLPTYPLKGQQRIDDTRHFEGHVFEHDRGNWLFTGHSYPLKSALQLNGINERMDGMKGLEDCDFGIRLQKIGHRFVMNRSVYLHILDHGNNHRKNPRTDGPDPNPPTRADEFTEIRSEVCRENYGVLDWGLELGELRANEKPITGKHLELCERAWERYRKDEPRPTDEAARQRWLETPTFSLKREREELRSSREWRW